ncbi:hypothetical protein IAD21_04441 [Abditibacteriota bacterium]|nr:hypothetical protein IAD21_04441 [Abditibacteriota bacterium]
MNHTTYIRTSDENTLIAINKMGGAPPYTVKADTVPCQAFSHPNTLKASAMQQVRDCAKANRLRLSEPGTVAIR